MEHGETQPAGAVTKRNHPPPLTPQGGGMGEEDFLHKI